MPARVQRPVLPNHRAAIMMTATFVFLCTYIRSLWLRRKRAAGRPD
jgi:hypothetical protein